MDCPARGQVKQGNIAIHSLKEKRAVCQVCHQTFATSKGTLFYRLRTDPQIMMWVIVLLAYGCPVPTIVKAFGLDERTVKSWQQRAGKHCQAVHEAVVASQTLDLQQVQVPGNQQRQEGDKHDKDQHLGNDAPGDYRSRFIHFSSQRP